MKIDLIVVGAGAAGLMAAGTAARRGRRVLLLERNTRPARKVMITGKGRCNVTNACNLLNDLIANVPVNGRFLYGAFSRFMPSDTMDFFEEQGVPLKIERGNRVFPESDKAVDIVDALCRFAGHPNVTLTQGRVAELLVEDGRLRGVKPRMVSGMRHPRCCLQPEAFPTRRRALPATAMHWPVRPGIR